MAVVSDVTIAVAAINAGFSQAQAVTAVAIALAESGGDAAATFHEADGTTSYGLWQINSVHTAVLGQGSWSVPNDNARMAYAIFHGRGNVWNDWSTWDTSKYVAFLDRGQKAVAKAVSGSGTTDPIGVPDPAVAAANAAAAGGTGATLDSFPGIPDGLSHAFDVFTSKAFWLRFGMWAGGILLVVAGFALLVTTFGLDTKVGSIAKVAGEAAV